MIKIYTDGSCLENPGNGGWAAIIFMNNEKIIISGRKKNTTNNQMELMAAIEALKKIPKDQEVQMYTDSKYVKMGITEWIKKWSQNDWEISKKHKIEWHWVKAHAGNPNNEEVDELAKKAANLN